jgi:protein ImuA
MVPASPQMPIAELRRLLARTHSNGIYEGKTLPFGIDAIDAVLPGGGLALGAVHEITEQGSDGARASLSAFFVAGILARYRVRSSGACTAAIFSRRLWRVSGCIRIA